jgi:hypothetical protein
VLRDGSQAAPARGDYRQAARSRGGAGRGPERSAGLPQDRGDGAYLYRWRKEYGGLRLDRAKRLQQLERENARLKRVVAEQVLGLALLKETAAGSW